MWLIIICKDNIVDDCYSIEEKEAAEEAFFLECKVIDEKFDLLDKDDILEEGFHAVGMYGVTLWNAFAQ
jgi:hypothetical protein